MAFLPPNTLVHSRYRVIGIVGRGGMGAVYEALDIRLQSRVALKQLTIQGEEVEQAFWREAHLLSGLRHPGLPRVIDYFEQDADRFLVMDFIDGEDLLYHARLAPLKLDLKRVCAWTLQVLDVLMYLHGRTPPILHRDLKPANIKLTDGDRIVVLDFGLAKGSLVVSDGTQTTPSLFAMSPPYASLEQSRGIGTTARSDLYSLGATVFHLVSGTVPPTALERSAAIVEGRGDPVEGDDWDPHGRVSEGLKEVIRSAMRLNAAERYGSAGEMLDAMHRVVATTDKPVPAVTTEPLADAGPTVPIAVLERVAGTDNPIPFTTGLEATTPPPQPGWLGLRELARGRWRMLALVGGVVLASVLLAAGLLPRLSVATGRLAESLGGEPPRESVLTLDAVVGPGRPEAEAGTVDASAASRSFHFDVAAGDRVFVRTIAYDAGLGALRVELLDPNQRQIVGTCLACGDLGVQLLDLPGRHRLVVRGDDPASGSYHLGITRVPPPQECAISRPAADGATSVSLDSKPNGFGPGCGVIAVPGDSDVYPIAMRSGESISVASLAFDPALAGLDVVLEDPGGVAVASALLETLPIKAATIRDGIFRLRVGSDRSPATGSYSFRLTIPAE
jgi:hypothetical protein